MLVNKLYINLPSFSKEGSKGNCLVITGTHQPKLYLTAFK